MNIFVYFEGILLNPGNFFLCAHGIARRVNKLTTAPTMATKMHLKINHLLDRCYVHFGLRFGSHVGPFGCPNRSKFDPTSSSNLICIKNTDFHENLIVHPKMDPKTTQDQAKTAPRRSQRPSFFIMIFVFDFGPFWAPFWSPFGTLLDPKIGSKSIQKHIKIMLGR